MYSYTCAERSYFSNLALVNKKHKFPIMANPSRGGDVPNVEDIKVLHRDPEVKPKKVASFGAKPRVRQKYGEIAGLPKEEDKEAFWLTGFFIERARRW